MARSGKASRATSTARGSKATTTDGMKRVRGTYVYPENLTPGKAGKTPGGMNHNCYSEQGKLETQAVFIPDDESEPDEPETVFVFVTSEQPPRSPEVDIEELIEAVAALLTLAVEHGPQFIRWWNSRVLPVVKSGWQKAAQGRVLGMRRVADRASATDSADAPQETAASVERKRGTRMSSAEAQARLVLAKLAKDFCDEQIQIVRGARIEDADGQGERGRVVHAPTPGQIANVARTLQSLDAATLAEVRTILGVGSQRGLLALDQP